MRYVVSGEEFCIGTGLVDSYFVTWCAVRYFEVGDTSMPMVHLSYPHISSYIPTAHNSLHYRAPSTFNPMHVAHPISTKPAMHVPMANPYTVTTFFSLYTPYLSCIPISCSSTPSFPLVPYPLFSYHPHTSYVSCPYPLPYSSLTSSFYSLSMSTPPPKPTQTHHHSRSCFHSSHPFPHHLLSLYTTSHSRTRSSH